MQEKYTLTTIVYLRFEISPFGTDCMTQHELKSNLPFTRIISIDGKIKGIVIFLLSILLTPPF